LYYGEFSSAQLGACEECVQDYGGKALFDAEVGYRFDQVVLSVGMRNIFDTFPDEASIDNSFGIFPWPAASPFGYNGRFLYTRAELLLGL
jgi:iron complex outermembrane receptor protein